MSFLVLLVLIQLVMGSPLPSMLQGDIRFLQPGDPEYDSSAQFPINEADPQGYRWSMDSVRWIKDAMVEAGSDGVAVLEEMQQVREAMTEALGQLSLMKPEFLIALREAGGLTGDQYRRQFRNIFTTTVGPLSQVANSLVFILCITLSSIAGNIQRVLPVLQPHSEIPAVKTLIQFIQNSCTTYVAKRTQDKFPFVKLAGSYPDIALIGLCQLHKDQRQKLIDTVAQQCAPVDSTKGKPALGSTWNIVRIDSDLDTFPMTSLPDWVRKNFLGHFSWRAAEQREHMSWEAYFWTKDVKRSNNTDQSNYRAGFHSDYYKNTVSDKFQMLLPNLDVHPVPAEGYTIADLLEVMISNMNYSFNTSSAASGSTTGAGGSGGTTTSPPQPPPTSTGSPPGPPGSAPPPSKEKGKGKPS